MGKWMRNLGNFSTWPEKIIPYDRKSTSWTFLVSIMNNNSPKMGTKHHARKYPICNMRFIDDYYDLFIDAASMLMRNFAGEETHPYSPPFHPPCNPCCRSWRRHFTLRLAHGTISRQTSFNQTSSFARNSSGECAMHNISMHSLALI